MWILFSCVYEKELENDDYNRKFYNQARKKSALTFIAFFAF